MYWNFSELLIPAGGDARAFAEGRPLIAEIGFGNGEFLAFLARKRPEAAIVGFEVSQVCIAKAARRALALGLSNVRLALGDARYLLRLVLPAASIDEVWMNFPCPWPKKRHEGRRVGGPSFVRALARGIKPGGRFTLATDVEQFAHDTAESFDASCEFCTNGVIEDPEREHLTKYERKWREMGRTTYMVEALRRSGGRVMDDDMIEHEAPAQGPEPRSWEQTCEDLRAMKGDELHGRERTVVFLDSYISDDAALIMIVTSDEGFEQKFYVKASRSSRGGARGKIDSVGSPYRTPAVKAALRHLTERAGVRF